MRLLLVLALLLSGCSQSPESREYRFFAFGTLVNLSLYGESEDRAESARAFTARRLDHYHGIWHAWQPGLLVAINRALARGKAITPAPETRRLIQSAQRYAKQSQQLFNPAIGRLIDLWGFHADGVPSGPPPEAPAIAKLAQENPTMADLRWRGNTLTSRNRALQLDFGAYAKGYAVDRIVAALKQRGFDNLIVNAGGDLKVLGAHGARPWRIAIRNPSGPGVYASIEAQPGDAIFTSGDYQRYFEFDGARYHHLIDPRTGYPARGVRSVTVITKNAALADAASTALFIAGPQRWPDVAARLGVELVLMIDTKGRARMTPIMSERIQFEMEPEPEVIVQTL